VALSAFIPSCGQVVQPGLVEEAIGLSAVVWFAFGFSFSFGSFSQDASQSSSDPAVHALECIALTVPEVDIPSSQYRTPSATTPSLCACCSFTV